MINDRHLAINEIGIGILGKRNNYYACFLKIGKRKKKCIVNIAVAKNPDVKKMSGANKSRS